MGKPAAQMAAHCQVTPENCARPSHRNVINKADEKIATRFMTFHFGFTWREDQRGEVDGSVTRMLAILCSVALQQLQLYISSRRLFVLPKSTYKSPIISI